MLSNPYFWSGKKVLITGHSGFKGAWMSILLTRLGAEIAGVSLPNDDPRHIFNSARINSLVSSHFADINNGDDIFEIMSKFKPDVIFHMAAQPLVIESYIHPLETMETNIMGTAKVILAAAKIYSVKSVVIVTSDKCYENVGKVEGYVESDALGGRDPYSASKGACEIVSRSLALSVLSGSQVTLATARAGNVIGGGDFSENRLIPDIVRSVLNGEKLDIRNPKSTRPWQHVLDPLNGYLRLAENIHDAEPGWGGGWNFGPSQNSTFSVRQILNYLIQEKRIELDVSMSAPPKYHEEILLHLDSQKSADLLGVSEVWGIRDALDKTIDWYFSQNKGLEMSKFSQDQVDENISSQSNGYEIV